MAAVERPLQSFSSSALVKSGSDIRDYRSLLDSVLSHLTLSLCFSDRRHSPAVSSSHEGLHGLSRSPLSRHHHLRSWSQSSSHCLPSSVEGSSLSRAGRSWSARSRGSRSPSRTSSRYDSGSPRCLSSWSRSPSHRAGEDRQEEQSLLEFMNVISQMQSESRLPEVPLEGRKILGFHVGLDNDEQLASSYRLPIGDAAADILANIDDLISLTTFGMQSKKVSKLLSYHGVCSHRFN